MQINILTITLILLLGNFPALAQKDTTVYNFTIRQEMVNKASKEVMGMTINGGIPGPTIRFKEGDYAVIYVKNEMEEETSVHWHGLLLPNFYDGVPYLTTPPIHPGEIQKYEFPLIQSGTYWYHSHTMLQEQSGVYGSIVIEPKEGETLEYDKELVMVLSDWTNQKPMNVLRNLKRGNEWYNIKKGTATPLNRVIARGAFGAQLNFWRQRMESADIADIYYPAFLNNGEEVQEYPQFEPGDKVRLRIINGAASSQFWMTFGGEDPLLVAADGLNVVPVRHNKTFIGIAETYDFIVTIPQTGKIEFKATAQDGSGYTSAFLGKGEVIGAPEVQRPDKIGMMKQMAQMDMRMGAPAMKFNPAEEEPHELMKNWGMQMDDEMNMEGMEHMDMNRDMKKGEEKMGSHMEGMEHSQMGHENGMNMDKASPEDQMEGMNMFPEYNYDYLKAPSSTVIDEDKPIRDVLLNLTGNMWRYIWSMNGVPLSEADMIKISKGEKVRITFNNLTMMHHPMHFHGHFFRVINKHGEYSPLKHTVNVPPMQKTVIEFDAIEDSDWFLHCHVLYHMIGGMARAVSYDTERDPRLAKYPAKILFKEGNRFYNWGMADIASHMTELNFVSSNIRNQFNLNAEVGYNENMEAEVTYERYLYDYFRVFAGVNLENEIENSLDEISATAIAGIRFFTPYMFNLDVRMDNKLRPEIRISREIMIFPRTAIFGNYEYQADFGWVNTLTKEGTSEPISYKGETTWSAGVEYFLSRNFSLMASYDNRFGAGGGLSVRF
ncbi:multicopper oxidase domain-containing protein [Cyclobacterium sp.]|jgi:CopA family copper-resistance protein|uniref:multicopper oxidase domain-containing protein n=1 Tax=Cyclobacterium sp. TaxID=1966343 RepID=UPI0019B6A346|nr:multicopper oxidase domain-containing protein [Cyclobacterium sp.]MBD3627738.1 multicopper oxidase domain-containing protein [Cyclobacterium sp.]